MEKSIIHLIYNLISYGYAHVERVISDPKTDISAEDKDGYTAVHILSHQDGVYDTHLLKLIMNRQDVDLNSINKHGYTPLLNTIDEDPYYLSGPYTMLVEDSRVNVNFQNNDGFSALHLLADDPNLIGYVDLLLKRKEIDISIKDKEGKTALDIAKEIGNDEVIDLIEEHIKKEHGKGNNKN